MQLNHYERKLPLTFSGDSKPVNSKKSSTAQEDVKLGNCWEGTLVGTCCAFLLGGSKWLFSLSLVQLELEATLIPVARKRWWFAERLPAEWIGSSQSWQKSALSSTQNMNAGLSYWWREKEEDKISNKDFWSFYNSNIHQIHQTMVFPFQQRC